MFENMACRGFVSVIGAFLTTTGIGLMYLWGIISIYATSYFRSLEIDNPTLTEEQTDIVFPLILLGQAMSMPLSSRFFKRSSPRVICMTTGILLSVIIYMSSYTQSFSTFSLLFGLCCGILIGIIHIIPIAHCHQYFPHKKTSVSGIIITASGVGTFIFSFMAIDMINANNQPLLENEFYGNEIASKFPQFLRTLSVSIFIMVFGGGLILFNFPKGDDKTKNQSANLVQALLNQQFELESHQQEERKSTKNPFGSMMYEMVYMNKGLDNKKYDEKTKYSFQNNDRQFWPSISYKQRQSSKYNPEPQVVLNQEPVITVVDKQNECPRVRDAPKQRIFWSLFLCILLSVNFNLLISCNYKNYVRMRYDDRYLSFLGAFGAIACGLSRFFLAGIASRALSFRGLLWILLMINCFMAFTIPYISSIKYIYSAYVIVSFVCYGGFLGIFPVLSTKIFGRRYGTQIYGLLFYSFACSNFIQLILMNLIEISFGYWFVFMASGGMGVFGLVMGKSVSSTAKEGYDWSQRIREHNERKRLLVH